MSEIQIVSVWGSPYAAFTTQAGVDACIKELRASADEFTRRAPVSIQACELDPAGVVVEAPAARQQPGWG